MPLPTGCASQRPPFRSTSCQSPYLPLLSPAETDRVDKFFEPRLFLSRDLDVPLELHGPLPAPGGDDDPQQGFALGVAFRPDELDEHPRLAVHRDFLQRLAEFGPLERGQMHLLAPAVDVAGQVSAGAADA